MSKKKIKSRRIATHTLQLDRSTTAELMRKPVSRKASLVIIGGMEVGRIVALRRGKPMVIGRSSKCSAVINDDGISREHAEVRCEGPERYVIRDLKSTNGVFVQGQRIETHLLKEGDKVLLGRRTILKFMLQDDWDVQYQQQMYESAVRDALTGAFNRMHFDERISSELSFTRRYKVPLSILMLDLDHFKQVNDTYGHQAGDQVLVMVSEVISGALRKEDFLARYGGEEFAIIARRTTQAGGVALGERLRVVVEEMKVLTSDNQLVPVTVSIGVATITGGAKIEAASFVKEADKNLYRAKEVGRNRVVTSEMEKG